MEDTDLELDEDECLPSDPPDRTRRYGVLWKPLHFLMQVDPKFLNQVPADVKRRWEDFYIELWQLRLQKQGFKGFTYHFTRLVDIVWGDPKWEFQWTWNPNANKMLEYACKHKYLGCAGAASSSKSMFGMIWGLVNWIIFPETTKVFITSTTLEDSRGRIWGDVERFWLKFSEFFGNIPELLPGDLVSSKGYIRSRINGQKSQKAGVALVAGAKGQDKDAAKKIGFKAQRVILIGDELPLLSEELYNAAKGNLFANPDFQFIGIGNPTSKYDPFGIFVEPKDGWASINENSLEWETKLGWCLRFDGKFSPNVVAGREIYKGLLTLEKYEAFVRNLGENSMEFWQMVRGFFSPTGRTDAIYWEVDFEKYRATRRVKEWVDMPVPVASLDPSFTHGGDSAIGTFGRVGMAQFDEWGKDYRKVLETVEQIDYNLLCDKSRNKSEEVVRLFAEDLKKRGIHTRDVAVDVTGADSFSTLLAQTIGSGFLQVKSSETASDLPVSKTDPRLGKERFYNRGTELWYIGKELLRTEQLAGIDQTLQSDLCARDYEMVGKGVVRIESKEKMKKRTGGKSPDRGDSWTLLVEVARKRHNLSSIEEAAKVVKKKNPIPPEFQWGVRRPKSIFARPSLSTMGSGLERNLST